MHKSKYKKYISKIKNLKGGNYNIQKYINDKIIHNDKEFIKYKNININKNSSVDIFIDTKDINNKLIGKKFINETEGRREFENYEEIKKLGFENFFPESFFIINEDDLGDEEYFLIMKQKENINIIPLKNKYEDFFKYFFEITTKIITLAENNIYYTDIKIENTIYDSERNEYLLVDFGGVCLSETFDCQMTYNFIPENIKSIKEITDTSEFNEKILESYNFIQKSTSQLFEEKEKEKDREEDKPKSPLFTNYPKIEDLYFFKVGTLILFLFWTLVLRIFDDINSGHECINNFHPIEIIKNINNLQLLGEKIKSCQGQIFINLASSIKKSNLDSKKKELHFEFFNDLYKKNIRTLVDFTERIKNLNIS
jgi:serine/threonine protein kinase